MNSGSVSTSSLFINSKQSNSIIERNTDFFFNSKISLIDLKKLSEDINVDQLFLNWNTTQKIYKNWVVGKPSSATPNPKVSSKKFPFLLTPPPGFEQVKPINHLSDLSTDSEASPTISDLKLCTITENEVKLQPAPNKQSLVKREKRGTFIEEHFSETRQDGEVKFYQLKKRFGFITLDEDKSDVFLCEDDLVLSGINIKKFKEAVFKRVQVRMNFVVKHYYENEQPKRKAVDVRIISDID